MKILVTGATGFVGSSLIQRLLEEGHEVTALTRTKKNQNKKNKVQWIQGDLLHAEKLPAIEKFDVVYYLVHGLKGEESYFEYQESLAAVNFINWVRIHHPKIIYLGGLGPDIPTLSPHLRSRHLTGAILGSSGLDVLEFRASIILGEGSASFEMIKAISERLPFRPDLTLLSHPCQPLSLEDLLKYLVHSLDQKITGHEIIEIGGPDIMTYGELLDMYAELAGLRRKVVKLPEVEAKVLTKALEYSIPEHSQVGVKLSQSLEHATVVTNDRAKKIFPDIKPVSARVAMDKARSESTSKYAPLWEKDFLKSLLSDKILTQSGLLSPDLLRNLEKVGKLRDIFSRK